MAHVRRAVFEDAIALARWLRTEDEAEVKASTGRSPLYALASGYFDSDPPLTMVGDHGEPVAMFGVVPDGEGVGRIWLLATDDLKKYQRPFLRQCRGYIEAFHVRWPLLWNVVDERNEQHVRWLRWCGFTFIRRHEYPFVEFCKLKESE